MSFLQELKRRNVLRVGAAYIVTAWLVVQVVETLFPVYGLSDGAIRMVVNVLAIGLLPVLVLAWVFEWTPEGLKRDEQTDHDAPSSVKAAKRLDRIILAVLALALAYFAVDKFVLDPQREAEQAEQQQAELEQVREQAREQGVVEGLEQSRGRASIAVMAFADLSPGGDQEYLGDGIAEDILNLLQRMPELDVRSRTSAFRFKGKDVSIPEIAELLDVDHVLEGSVRRIGDRIRITAQLIDGRTDSHIWSENFDRETDDVFAIMDEISLAAAEQVGIELLSEPPRADRIDADAYFLYLRGNHLVYYIDPFTAAGYFEQALAIEPDYVEALLGLSRAYWDMRQTNASPVGSEGEDYAAKSDAAWLRAKELAPGHAVILAWDGFNAMRRGKYQEAARLLESALLGNPNNFDIVEGGILLALAIRRNELAVRLAEGAVRRDPYCGACNYRLAMALYRVGRYAESEAAVLRFWELNPETPAGRMFMTQALMMQGKYDRALEYYEKYSRGNEEEAWWGPLMVRALQGEDVSEDLDELEPTGASRVQLAEVSAVAGDTERAFRLLADVEADEEQSFQYRFVNSNFLENLHDDPRWLAIEERAGLAPHQLAKIQFNPRLPRLGSG
jgi:TolB-like protein/thioredoxin-like negative regulator of GroEL